MHNGCIAAMPVTLTIKQVPDRVADRLRLRAAASHRSLQGELMAILEDAVSQGTHQARQPEPPPYAVKAPAKSAPKTVPAHGKRLTLGELWARARRLGPPSKSESAAMVRKLRDERHNR
jgi:plasmid stability protein